MTKPLARRSFLKALSAAPLAAQTLAAKVATLETAAALTQAGMGMAPGVPQAYGIYSLLNSDALMTLHGMGMLPEWVRDDVERDIRREAAFHMEPSLMSLRSVSLAAKRTIQVSRALDHTWGTLAHERAKQMARQAFFSNPNGPATRVG